MTKTAQVGHVFVNKFIGIVGCPATQVTLLRDIARTPHLYPA